MTVRSVFWQKFTALIQQKSLRVTSKTHKKDPELRKKPKIHNTPKLRAFYGFTRSEFNNFYSWKFLLFTDFYGMTIKLDNFTDIFYQWLQSNCSFYNFNILA